MQIEETHVARTPEELATVLKLRRPHKNLLVYYTLGSLLLGPFFFFALIPLFFRYKTLRYEFDDEGVSMRWGILFRREISLNYSRLQDIHLKSNFIERWLGLGDVKLQTASGSSGAEMTIEGFQEFELVRDFLYSRMRGNRPAGGRDGMREVASNDLAAPGAPSLGHGSSALSAIVTDSRVSGEVLAELRAARGEMSRLADALERLASVDGRGPRS